MLFDFFSSSALWLFPAFVRNRKWNKEQEKGNGWGPGGLMELIIVILLSPVSILTNKKPDGPQQVGLWQNILLDFCFSGLYSRYILMILAGQFSFLYTKLLFILH
jgi:hypothetical protein